MLVLGHVASATLTARCTGWKVDLRWVIFLTLLADLVDKPLGLVLFRESINNGRVYFHSLIVNLGLTMVLILWRKPLLYPLSLWLHQLCDRMWMRPWVALWPFTGGFGYRDLPIDDWVYSVLNPYNVTTEALGLVVVGWFTYRYRLYERRPLERFLRSGRLESGGAVSKAVPRASERPAVGAADEGSH